MESNTRGKQKGMKGKLERTAWFLGKIYMFRSKCTLVRVKIHKVPGDKMETSLQRLMSELIIILREEEGWIQCGVHGTPQLFTGLDSALKLVTSYLEATVTMLGVVRAWQSKWTKKERERERKLPVISWRIYAGCALLFYLVYSKFHLRCQRQPHGLQLAHVRLSCTGLCKSGLKNCFFLTEIYI